MNKQLDAILTRIAGHHLGVETLEVRNSDRLDFHDVSVWGIRDALLAAWQAGVNASNPHHQGDCVRHTPLHRATWTTADADRLLGLADQFLAEWAIEALQSGARDADYEARHAAWQAIRPVLAAAPAVLDALEGLRHALRQVSAYDPFAQGDVAAWDSLAEAAIATARGEG